MKRKRSAAPVTAAAAVVQSAAPEKLKPAGLSARDMAKIVVFSLLLFLSMIVQTGRMSLVLAVLALVLSVGKSPFKNLRERLSIPVIGLMAFAVMNGFAAIYSNFGEYAVKEFVKVLASVSLALIVLLQSRRPQMRSLLWGFSGVCSAISLLCVDSASWMHLYNGFVGVAEKLGASYAISTEADQWNNRINGIFNDANLTASLLALGLLVLLYLIDSSRTKREKVAGSLLLGMTGVGFFLSMSRGAILCFAISLLIFLLTAGKERRLPLLILMVESVIVTFGCAAASFPFFQGRSPVPDLLALVSGLILFVLDAFVGSRISRRLAGHGKAVLISVSALAGCCAVYAIAAVLITGPYTFEEKLSYDRAITLSPGTYTITGDWDGEPSVVMAERSGYNLLAGGETQIYNGPLDGGTFTVSEESASIRMRFWGAEGETLRKVVFRSESGEKALKLNYVLVPDFLESRLQGGILANGNMLQRIQYDKDGLKLFASSPLIGHGLGSTEGLLTSVQPYYYESLYIHNHLIQILDEMGVVGLFFFLLLMGGSVWLLLRRLRQESDPMAAMLLACIAMMNLHGLMEISFSVRMYQCAAFFLLMVVAVEYAHPVSVKHTKVVGWGAMAVIWAWLVVFGGLYESHRIVQIQMSKYEATSVKDFMESYRSFVSRDVFDHEQAQLTYVGNAVILDSSAYNGPMNAYVRELRDSGTYTACSGLARYYYLPKGQLEELFACSREGIAQEASAVDAWDLQIAFYRDDVLPSISEDDFPTFLNGVLATADYLANFNQGRIQQITISEENQTFLDLAASIRESGLDNADGYALLRTITETVSAEEDSAEQP